MIDIAKTRFIVFAWPDHRWPTDTIWWIEQLTKGVHTRVDYRDSIKVPNRECARNYAIAVSALRSDKEFEHFIFIDRDVRPCPRTSEFLSLEADIKSCQMTHRSPTAYSRPDSFHDGLWCISRKALEQIEPPWFVQRYNDTHTAMRGCICQSFRDKAKEAGLSVAHGGWAEHDNDQSWCE